MRKKIKVRDPVPVAKIAGRKHQDASVPAGTEEAIREHLRHPIGSLLSEHARGRSTPLAPILFGCDVKFGNVSDEEFASALIDMAAGQCAMGFGYYHRHMPMYLPWERVKNLSLGMMPMCVFRKIGEIITKIDAATDSKDAARSAAHKELMCAVNFRKKFYRGLHKGDADHEGSDALAVGIGSESYGSETDRFTLKIGSPMPFDVDEEVMYGRISYGPESIWIADVTIDDDGYMRPISFNDWAGIECHLAGIIASAQRVHNFNMSGSKFETMRSLSREGPSSSYKSKRVARSR